MTTPLDELGLTGADLYEQTAPAAYADADHDYAWARFLGALAVLLDPVAEMVRDDDEGNPGWTALASPRRCPTDWLGVLAQWAGIRASLAQAMSEEDLRELIGPRAPGMWRGTRAAMMNAVRRFLPPGTADSLLRFDERAGGDPYKLRVFTYAFVEHDPAQVRAALEAAKPAGLQLIYEVRDGQSYDQLNLDCMSYRAMRDVYEDYYDVYSSMPGRCALWVPEKEWELTSVSPDDLSQMAAGGPTVFEWTGQLLQTADLSMQMVRDSNTWPGQNLVVDSETRWRVNWFRPATGPGEYQIWLLDGGERVAEFIIQWTAPDADADDDDD